MGCNVQRGLRTAGVHGLHASLGGRFGHGVEFGGGGHIFAAIGGVTSKTCNEPLTMDILYLLIPLSVVLVLLILVGLWWAIHSGQFDRIEGEAERILRQD